MIPGLIARTLPKELQALSDLALNLRFTWGGVAEEFWRAVSPEIWDQTENPWIMLQQVPQERFKELASNKLQMAEFRSLLEWLEEFMRDPGWYGREHPDASMKGVAYFSMEFGLGEGLPLYAGGLGVLAGDHLKTASDLGVPVIGVGLLYQEGYFRQVLDASGWQDEVYPYNDPSSLPIQPVLSPEGTWFQVSLELPAIQLLLRIWQAQIGRIKLYLLDSNHPLNGPRMRGITSTLYGGGTELRLAQEIVLGIGGWLTLETLGLDVDVCHLNEGHAAFAVLERVRWFMKKNHVSFWEALCATRAGNLFTTHTPVPAGFDTYSEAIIRQYFSYMPRYFKELGISVDELLALGRRNPKDTSEPFNMAYFAMRGCSWANGVSQLHGEVSRGIFRDLYPSWPEGEVPIGHVTNGVHMPSWNSGGAYNVWTNASGKELCWADDLTGLSDAVSTIPDEEIWSMRGQLRADFVGYVRRRLAHQAARRGASLDDVKHCGHVLDPGVLTLGFARRFTEYKRPNLLLKDRDRLVRLLTDSRHPVQLVLAGKAHPQDEPGKRMLQEWAHFVSNPTVRDHVVLLEDYDIAVAEQMVQGVDVWVNTPRRPWEASGTSGMKVLVNGGLNVSVLDGWWAEAYSPQVGWAIGDGLEHHEPGWDDVEAEELYRIIEQKIVPEFYARDSQGIPRAWIERIRASMSLLAPQYSSNRMVRDYVDELYVPAARQFRRRAEGNCRAARELYAWKTKLERCWQSLCFGKTVVTEEADRWRFEVEVFLGEIGIDEVQVQLYADPMDGNVATCLVMEPVRAIQGSTDGHIFRADAPASRPVEHFTPRIVPFHPEARTPMEIALILWQR